MLTAVEMDDRRTRRAKQALRMAKLTAAVSAARALVVEMHHTGMKGLYQIPPAAVLRLCVAVDDVPVLLDEGDE